MANVSSGTFTCPDTLANSYRAAAVPSSVAAQLQRTENFPSTYSALHFSLWLNFVPNDAGHFCKVSNLSNSSKLDLGKRIALHNG